MEQSSPPGVLGLSEGLGPLPEDTLRWHAFPILSRLQSGTDDVVRLDVALAAVAAERERCAAIADEFDECRDFGAGDVIRGGPNVVVQGRAETTPAKHEARDSRVPCNHLLCGIC